MPETTKIVKEVPNAVLYDDGTILLKDVRLSYPHVFKLYEQTDDDGKKTASYGCVGLMPKTTHDAAKKLLVEVMNQVLKDNNKGEKLPNKRKFLRDGDPRPDADGEVEPGKPEEAGMWVVSSREQPGKRPFTLHRIKDPKTGKAKRLDPDVPADCDVIYGGCWGNMLIRPWWQNHPKYGKRINCGIVGVMFRRDDTPFGKGRISDAEIDDRMGEVDESDLTEEEADEEFAL
jgi:hypothetical protein